MQNINQNMNNKMNKNLTLHYSSTYQGMPIITKYTPMIKDYLVNILATVVDGLLEHRRIRIFRFDLYLPPCSDEIEDSTVLTNFIRSIKAKLPSIEHKTIQSGKRWHKSSVRYVWAREYSTTGRPHYHVALLLNGDTFWSFGKFDPAERNLYAIIHEAWASALGIPTALINGHVYIPSHPIYCVQRGQSIRDAFYRLSYLAKAQTKIWGNHTHAFGCSRKKFVHDNLHGIIEFTPLINEEPLL